MPPGNPSPSAAVNAFMELNPEQQKKALSFMSDDHIKLLSDTLNVRSASTKSPQADIPDPRGRVGMTPMATPGLQPAKFATESRNIVEKAGKGLWEANKGPFGIAGGIVSGIAGAGAAAAHELKGEPQPGRSVLSAPGMSIPQRLAGATDAAIGGDPGAARMAKLEGNTGKAEADLFTMPLLGIMFGQVAGKKLPGLRDTVEEIQPERRQIASIQRLMGRDAIHAGPVETAQRIAGVQDLWKQAAREMGLKDSDVNPSFMRRVGREVAGKFTGRASGQRDFVGEIRRDSQRALDISAKAADIADRPLAKLIDTYGKESAGDLGEQIGQSLDEAASKTVDDGLRKSLREMAQKVRGAKTLADLNEIKSHANKEAAGLYSNVPGKEIANSASTTYAYRLGADEIRARMYPRLQQLAGSGSGIDLSELGRRESDAIATRDGMYRTYYSQIAPEQASKEALKFGEYVFGEGPDHSLYTRHFLRRGAEAAGILPGPAVTFNRMAGRGLGPLGVGGGVESVTASGRPQLLLGGSTAPTRFTIPTGLPEEITTPGNLSTRSIYEGQREVPNPNYDPFQEEGGNSYKYGSGSPAGRRSALGTTGGVTPDESFTGSPRRSQSVWQRVVEGEGPSVRTEGGGVMATTDPQVAQSTLDRITDRLERGNLDAETRTRLSIAKANLEKQLRDYRAYQGKTPPANVRRTPGSRGTRTIRRPVRRSLTGITAAQTAEQPERDRRKSLPPITSEDEQ